MKNNTITIPQPNLIPNLIIEAKAEGATETEELKKKQELKKKKINQIRTNAKHKGPFNHSLY